MFEDLVNLTRWVNAPDYAVWRRRLGYSVSLATLGLVMYAVVRDYEALVSSLEQASWERLVLATAFNLIAQPILPLGWHRMLRCSGYDLPKPQVFKIYFLTGIARYLPGGIWHFAGRLAWLRDLSVPAAVSVRIIIGEQLMVLWTALVTALYLVSAPTLSGMKYHVLFGILCLVLLIVSGVLVTLIVSSRSLRNRQLRLGFAAPLLLLYAIFWVLNGISLCLVISAFGCPDRLPGWLQGMGYAPLSWAIGYLVIVSPSGIGVRESVLTILLSAWVPVSAAGTIALVTRVLLIVSESVWLLIGFRIPSPSP